jgi:hypothetical protein
MPSLNSGEFRGESQWWRDQQYGEERRVHTSSLAKDNGQRGRKFGLGGDRRFLYRVAAKEWRGVCPWRRRVEEGRGAW